MATNNAGNIPTGASLTVLQGQGIGSQLAFSTATYPATVSTGKLLYGSSTNVVGLFAGAANNAFGFDNSSNPVSIAPPAAGTVLQGVSGGAPAFSSATYPVSTTSQQILYSTATNTVGQLTTANSALAATNASGTLAMRAFVVKNQTFTGNGTYTPTTGMLYCKIEVIGGGGGGGGAASTSVAQGAAGGGGGSGGYASKVVSAATIGASQTVTVGALGAGGTAGANTGSAGGTTSVGAIVSATGGGGGTGSGVSTATVAIIAVGGAAGAGSSGDFNAAGSPGGSGYSFGGTPPTASSGTGGSSVYGGGAVGIGATSTATQAGVAASAYGSGGSGGYGLISQAAAAGGNGSAGIVIITEYIIN